MSFTPIWKLGKNKPETATKMPEAALIERRNHHLSLMLTYMNSLQYECNKGLRGGYVDTGYLSEKMHSLKREYNELLEEAKGK